ncbi:UNVERIFIED_CONTAM: hypothetical protein Sradi_5612600 [Sesamum radiatum]|uniref:RNase H type-1 domain-containing protein n=1 Tax=Sesamum radiatum TaxID=300843 RepID=A0AAW2L010_SESRA
MPLKQTLGKPDTSGRLIKWSRTKRIRYFISTSRYNQSQTLVDFISEMTETPLGDAPKYEKWLLHVDGSSTIQGSGAGIIITSSQGEYLDFAVKFDFKASNNEAEYEALVVDMKIAHEQELDTS